MSVVVLSPLCNTAKRGKEKSFSLSLLNHKILKVRFMLTHETPLRVLNCLLFSIILYYILYRVLIMKGGNSSGWLGLDWLR